ncbi:MAG: hypothetical protein V7L25_33860 [Nostoc sp.]
MNRLSKEDLAQMNRDYFQSLDKEKLAEVAVNLHACKNMVYTQSLNRYFNQPPHWNIFR